MQKTSPYLFRLAAVIDSRHWTQSELAKKIGIKQATISNFENNPDNTTLTTFFKILQSLELSMTLCDAKNASPESTEQQNLEW